MTNLSASRSSNRRFIEHAHAADPESECSTCAYLSWPESTQMLALAISDTVWHETAGDIADDVVEALGNLGYEIVKR